MPAADFAETVRETDPDRHLSILYAAEERRSDLAALHAFDIEVAGLRRRIREPMAGEIRLQWWRDALAAPAGQATGHPLADALRATIAERRLPLKPFVDLLDARVFDLYDDPMPSVGDLEGYCGETASAVIQLAALILDREAAPSAADAAGHGGCALAITRMIAALPATQARGQCYLPGDLLAAAGSDAQAFVSGADMPAAARAVAAFAALARQHLGSFERRAGDLPPTLRPAFLPLAVVPAMLARIEREPAAALKRSIDIGPFRRHWLTFRHAMRGWPKR